MKVEGRRFRRAAEPAISTNSETMRFVSLTRGRPATPYRRRDDENCTGNPDGQGDQTDGAHQRVVIIAKQADVSENASSNYGNVRIGSHTCRDEKEHSGRNARNREGQRHKVS